MNLILTDCQEIEAVNTVILTGLEYYMNASLLNRSWLIKKDSQVRQIVKRSKTYKKNNKCLFSHSRKTWRFKA